MKKTWKKACGLLLLLAVLLSAVPGIMIAANASGTVILLVNSAAADDEAPHGEGATYKTVAGALAKANGGDTVKLTGDITENVTVKKNITLDLNGYVLTGTGGDSVVAVNKDYELTVTDSRPDAVHYFKYSKTGVWKQAPEAAEGIELTAIDDQTAEDTVVKIAGGCITGGSGKNLNDLGILYGGGIYTKGKVILKAGNVIGNTATDGGGIAGVSLSTIIVQQGRILGNAATDGGGIWSKVSLTVENEAAYIGYNTAAEYGGGIYGKVTLTLSKGKIEHNAAASGGGIFVSEKASSLVMKSSDALIRYNTASSGGGVYSKGGFTLEAGTVAYNKASANGGGVYNAGTFTLKAGTVSDNEAGGNGGGVQNVSAFNMVDENSLITRNTAENGGGVSNPSAESVFTMTAGTISFNKVPHEEVDDWQGEITTGYGGGVRNTIGTFVMKGGSICENEATVGGAVSVMNKGTFVLKDGSLKKNKAVKYSGGVFSNSIFFMLGGEISENTCQYTAGGVMNHVSGTDGIMVMTGGSITGNTAQYAGGLVNAKKLVLGGTAKISGNTGKYPNMLTAVVKDGQKCTFAVGDGTEAYTYTDENGTAHNVPALAEGAEIGLTLLDTMVLPEMTGVPGAGQVATNGKEGDLSYFNCDISGFSLIASDGHLAMKGNEVEVIGADDKPIEDAGVKTVAKEAIEDVNEKLEKAAAEFNGNGETEAISESIAEVLGGSGYVDVKLTGITVDMDAGSATETAKVTTYTFEVTPYDDQGEEQHSLSDYVTFRLPVPKDCGCAYINLYHEGKYIGQYPVTAGKDYIEVSAKEFSEYSYMFTDIMQDTVPALTRLDKAEAVAGDMILHLGCRTLKQYTVEKTDGGYLVKKNSAYLAIDGSKKLICTEDAAEATVWKYNGGLYADVGTGSARRCVRFYLAVTCCDKPYLSILKTEAKVSYDKIVPSKETVSLDYSRGTAVGGLLKEPCYRFTITAPRGAEVAYSTCLVRKTGTYFVSHIRHCKVRIYVTDKEGTQTVWLATLVDGQYQMSIID